VSRSYDCYKYLLLAFADFWYMNLCFAIYCGAAGVYFVWWQSIGLEKSFWIVVRERL